MLNLKMKLLLGAAALVGAAAPAAAQDDKIVIGFATGQCGFMQAYDEPATQAAQIRIDEINAAGGLLDQQIETMFADTKSGGAKAGLELIEAGAT